MTVSKETIFVLLLMLGYVAGDVYFAKQAHQKLDKLVQDNENFTTAALFRVARCEARIDSIKTQTKAVAESVIYVDSVATTKTSKSERAERRGRFVGGLLKGLIPGL